MVTRLHSCPSFIQPQHPRRFFIVEAVNSGKDVHEVGLPTEMLFSQVKQPSAVGHGDGFGAAQDVELFENGLDVALDGDLRDGQVSADQFIGFAGRKQSQDFTLAWSQFFSG